MPYIGHSPEVAQRRYESVDDISGSFNGSTTSFALQVGGVTPAPFPVASENVLISVGGVIQEPDGTGTNGFQLSGTNIVFSSAPAAGQSFFGVILAGADYVTAGHAFPDGDVSSPSITFASDLDTGLFRPDSGALAFGGNGVERLRVDANGRLMLGTTTEGEHTADDLTVATSGDTGISIRSGTSSSGKLFFSDGTSSADEYRGFIQYAHSGNAMSFGTDSTERVRIDSSGNVGIGLTSPSSKAHIKGGSLTVEHNSPNTGTGQININVENNSQTSFSYDDQGSVVFGTSATPHNQGSFSEKMRLDSNGSLGIGVNNAADYHANANDLVLANGMTIAHATTAHMYFADSSTGTGEYVGQLNYQHAHDRFQFVVGNTARALLLSTGDWATFSTAVNIDIANTQSAGNNEAFIYARHSSTQLTGGTLAFRVYTNGNVQNINNSYGST